MQARSDNHKLRSIHIAKKCQVAFAKLVFVRMVPGLQNDIALAEVALDILTHLNKNIKTSPYKK